MADLPKRIRVDLRMKSYIPWHQYWATPINDQWCIREGDGAYTGCVVLTHTPTGLAAAAFDASEADVYAALTSAPAPHVATPELGPDHLPAQPFPTLQEAEAVKAWIGAAWSALGRRDYTTETMRMIGLTRHTDKGDERVIREAVREQGERPAEVAARMGLTAQRVAAIAASIEIESEG